ncbi:MAG: DNA polymerase III subunit delta [Actinomycetota bacterium]
MPPSKPPADALPAYLIAGDDPHLAGVALGKLVENVSEESIDRFGPADDVDRVLQALVTPSMFGDRRFVVVREVDRLGAEALRLLAAYFESPSPDVTAVLMGAKFPAPLLAAVRKVGHVVDAAKGKRSDLLVWLKQELRAKGFSAGGDVMNALVEAVGEQRLALSRAVEELGLAQPEGGRLTGARVSGQFQGRADAKLFGFIDAVAERQGSLALQTLHHLVRQGESEQMLFWSLTRHFRMLVQAQGQPPALIAKELGIQAWRAEKLVRQARGFKPGALVAAYRLLAEADVKIKQSEEPEGLTLERVVVAISARS